MVFIPGKENCYGKEKYRTWHVANVQEFNRICGHMDFDVDLAQGKYLVDAKSIMGIFSLDMEKPLELCANTNDEALIDEKFKAFIQ